MAGAWFGDWRARVRHDDQMMQSRVLVGVIQVQTLMNVVVQGNLHLRLGKTLVRLDENTVVRGMEGRLGGRKLSGNQPNTETRHTEGDFGTVEHSNTRRRTSFTVRRGKSQHCSKTHQPTIIGESNCAPPERTRSKGRKEERKVSSTEWLAHQQNILPRNMP